MLFVMIVGGNEGDLLCQGDFMDDSVGDFMEDSGGFLEIIPGIIFIVVTSTSMVSLLGQEAFLWGF